MGLLDSEAPARRREVAALDHERVAVDASDGAAKTSARVDDRRRAGERDRAHDVEVFVVQRRGALVDSDLEQEERREEDVRDVDRLADVRGRLLAVIVAPCAQARFVERQAGPGSEARKRLLPTSLQPCDSRRAGRCFGAALRSDAGLLADRRAIQTVAVRHDVFAAERVADRERVGEPEARIAVGPSRDRDRVARLERVRLDAVGAQHRHGLRLDFPTCDTVSDLDPVLRIRSRVDDERRMGAAQLEVDDDSAQLDDLVRIEHGRGMMGMRGAG